MTDLIFTMRQIDAIANDQLAAMERIDARKAAGQYVGPDAYSSRFDIYEKALAAAEACAGVDGFGHETHIELQAAMEAFGCDSVWWPITPERMSHFSHIGLFNRHTAERILVDGRWIANPTARPDWRTAGFEREGGL